VGMTCPGCSAPNGATAKFCSECGTRLSVVCPGCGTPAGTGKFCAECGTPLQAGAAPPATAPSTPADLPSQRSDSPVAERRMTSLLFADLVGFTALSEQRDHEEVRELLSRYFATARTVIGRYGGTIEKFIGDAVMAVWGVPVAHEDDAERAVRAGLDLVESLTALGEAVGEPGLTMRVGIVTGEVAVTLGATGEGMVAGDPVNTAARVQAAATPGEVWVDNTTRGLTVAAVTFDDVGMHEMKGKAEPVQLFVARQVVAARGGVQRVDGLEAPFTGHDRDLRLIKEIFHATEEDQRARLVSVIGGAGVGKSRIAWEFEKYIDGLSQNVRWHRGRCLAYGEGVAFWAFAEMVRGRMGIVDGDSAPVVVAKLDETLAEFIDEPEERTWLRPRLAALLDMGEVVAPGESFTRPDLFTAWRVLLERLSADDRIVALVFEDLQWADDGLLDFIDYLLDAARFPLFLFTLSRPELAEARPQWGNSRRATQIYLEPLADEVMGRLVDGLVAGLPDDVRSALVERSEGVPLYAVETVRALIDRDAVVPREGRYVLADQSFDVSSLGAPASLQALIAARLDALPPAERRAVQDASVLGQAFTEEGLVALSDGRPIDAAAVLDSLVRKEILHVEADPRSPERGQYQWVQGLVRTVAYETLAKRDRKARHLAAVAYFDEVAEHDELAGVIASHYLSAIESAPADADAPELRRQAVRLLEQAANRARGLGAFTEALRYFESALGLSEADVDTARLSQAAAAAAIVLARFADALPFALAARDIHQRNDDAFAAAAALAQVGECWVALGEAPRAVAEIRPVYEHLEGEPGAERVAAVLSMVLASAMRALAQPKASMAYYERTIELVEGLADWPWLVRALNSYGGTVAACGRPVMGLSMMQGALDLARRENVVGADVMPLNNLLAMQLYRDLPPALKAGEEGLAVSRRLGEAGSELWIAVNLTFAYWLNGRWDELETLHAEYSPDDMPTQLRHPFLCSRAFVQAARGEQVDVELQHELTDDVSEHAFVRLLEATDAMAQGRVSEWAEAAISATDLMHSLSGIDDDYALFWPFAVEGALAAGRFDDAVRLIGLVAAAPPGLVPRFLGALLHRFEAKLAIAHGREEAVDEGLARAADELREFGAPYWCARVLLERGTWLAEHGREDEAERVLAEAREIFEELGARPWIDSIPTRQLSVEPRSLVD
jgi:class 3 adenylate cyclase/tetratricopeptide (TPR) repeat protein